VLQYDSTQHQFVGGNFWDMRATGLRLGNPAAEQAQGPPVNPVEMGLPDTACAVYRVSQSGYRGLFEQLWGAQSFAISWPANVEEVCSTPGPPPANDPFPVHLSDVDRGTSNSTFDHLTLSMAAYEASPDVSPFSSKFDYAVSNPQQQVFSKDELAGLQLFRGKGKCNTCHLDGTQNTAGTTTRPTPKSSPNLFATATNAGPLFSDFQAHNLGIPANEALPYYCESTPDQYGYVANPLGQNYVDYGVGAFLAGNAAAPNPNQQWAQYAPQFNGTFQTPTLRNVDKRPRPDFVKAYMNNGYFKSLKEVVHFYNTRDVLPRCTDPLDPQAGVACWPAPAVSANEDTTIGNLGLTDQEENQIVAFLTTLTDGYMHIAAPGDAIGASIGSTSTPSQ
jgi:cytochrome c peroxidase